MTVAICSAGIYHRFTLDEGNAIQAMRLFKVGAFDVEYLCTWRSCLLSTRTSLSGHLTTAARRRMSTRTGSITCRRSRALRD
jgi:hypothetical protein